MADSMLIHNMIRICPQSGDVLEEEARIRALAELRETPLALTSPRNAYVSFQIIVDLNGGHAADLSIEAEPLQGDRDAIAAAEYTFYAQWYHHIDGKYYPDALVPLTEGGASVRTLGEVTGLNAVPGQAYAACWVDLFVPADIHPGEYKGAVRVRTGNAVQTLPFTLHVITTIVPNESLMIADLNSYADNLSNRMKYLRNNEERYEDGTYYKVERQFFRMAHEHRCLLHYLPYEHSGAVPPVFIPELGGKGKELRVKDWSTFDEHFGPYLDGSAFADTKRGAIPIPYMYLPFNFHWPADYVKFGTKGYRSEFTSVMNAFHRHFTERGWLHTTFELFLNHKKRYKLFPYDGDETRFVWDEKVNDIFYELARDALEAKEGARFVFRTDASWSYGLHFGKYADKIKLWVVNALIFSWFPESLPVLRAAGDTIWTYGAAEKIGQTLLGTAISPLTAILRGVDGFVYWENTHWGARWFETPLGEGSETLFYPGDELFGILGPIPSIRLKTLRNVMQLADCMEAWIRRQPEGGRERMSGLIAEALDIAPGSWWPGKSDLVNKPPYEWDDAGFSEAPRARLHQGKPPEALGDLTRNIWRILG